MPNLVETMQTTKLSILFCFLFASVATPIAPTYAVEAEPIAFWDDHEANSRLKPDHSAWQSVLDTYLVDDHPSEINRFDYAAVSAEDEKKLLGYVSYLQQLDPRQLNRASQQAYWLNLYNATLVLYVIVAAPRNSIRSLNRSDFWSTERFNITQQNLSFDDIEHGILRPLYNDPRILFALNRATLGSANLSATAFTAANLDEMLESSARGFVNHPRALKISKNEIELSRLFHWYQSDFGGDIQAVKAYLKTYLDEQTAFEIEQTSKVRYQFDWALNKP